MSVVTVGLERIGDHDRHLRARRVKAGARMTARDWRPLPRPWIAEVTGRQSSGAPVRVFLEPLRDYTHATRSGNRGVMDYYHLRPGVLYEVQATPKIGVMERYFAVVDGRTLRRVTAQEVLSWRF